MTIRGDSTEYELLKIWCETLPFYDKPKSVKTCEIGVREGLGSQVIMLAIKSRIGNVLYEHIGIDPYGDITYQHYDKSPEYKSNYSDAMRIQLLKDFADNKDFILEHCTDIEYMKSNTTKDIIFDLVYFELDKVIRDQISDILLGTLVL